MNNDDKLRDYLKKVTADLRRARRRIREVEEAGQEPIAIIGMGCRYPGGVASPQDLWGLVASGGDAVSHFPDNRGWDVSALYDDDPGSSGTSYVQEGGFLYDAGEFDPGFFGISPREALAMDPQQRLLLQTSWEAVEHAGIDPTTLRGSRTGVFVGAAYQGYGADGGEELKAVEGHLMTGNATSVVSGRLSYTFGLEGPAVTVDTACSSSLVALHLAMQSLRQGESELALVGGVAVMINPDMFVEFSRQRGLAADGRCKAFAEAADGTGWGEGAGMLVVERLSDALRNGHPVLAVVRGSAVNQDGASSGLSAPNGPSQQRVIRQALANARLSAADVDAVEAHGTGTTLGDPIEAQALLATYGSEREPERPLWLGSLKSNIGHTQAAAGVGGVIKMVMAMRVGVLPRTLHVDAPSSHVDWSAGAVELLTESREWPEAERARRSAVSSFGISGTNAHVVLEQAPEPEAEAGDGADRVPAVGGVVPWVVSGKSEGALRGQAGRLAAHVAGLEGGLGGVVEPVDVGWSLVSSRSVFEHRAVVVGAGREELLARLSAVAGGAPDAGVVSGVASGGSGKVALVFPGQGSQWVGMAVELLDCAPVFAERLGECADALAPYTDWDLLSVLRGTEGAPSLDRVDVVQPVLFAVMVSLAELWRSYGVKPDAVIGHSQGEIAAAAVAGALSLEDAARVVALRSKALLALVGEGGMVSVAAPLVDVEARITAWGGRVGVAAVNGPAAVVVSGEPDALDELLAACEADGVRARRVPVDYASHSVQVERIRAELLEVLAPITPRSAEVGFFSTVTGEWVGGEELDAEYWYSNLRQTVQLQQTVEALAAEGFGTFIEASAHPVLTTSIGDALEAADVPHARALGSLRRDEGGMDRFLLSLGEAYVHGVAVDWSPLFTGARRIDLPTYAFQQKHFWLEPGTAAPESGPADPVDARFWEVVDSADLQALADTLDVDAEATLSELLPALTRWRSCRKEQHTLDSWRYRATWKPLSVTGGHRLTGTWAVVVPEGAGAHPAVTAVRDALATQGADPVLIELTGAETCRAAVAERLRTEAAAPKGVVSLLALAEQPHPLYPELPAGVAGTLLLAQAMGDAEFGAPLWLLTQGGVAAGAHDAAPSPEQAQVWGLGRVIGLEYPQLWGGLVDLPQDLDERTAALVAGRLAAGGDEDQLAVRPAGVLAQRLERSPRTGGADREWTCRGTVLVTGGTGALGPRIARWLAAAGAGHIVLVSRRGAAAPGADEAAADLAGVGVPVTFEACDVADRADLEALIGRLEADGHDIRAVFHAAALIELAAIDRTDLAEFAGVARAKVAGARNLDAVLDRDLDAFVLFSSIAGVWGSGDHAAYAAANAHLDALAVRRRARGLRATSLAWGVWNAVNPYDDSKQNQDVDAERLIRQGLPFLDPDLALSGLGQALVDDETFLALADVDWARFAPVFCAARPRPLLAGVPEARRALEAAASAAGTPAPEASGELHGRLSALSEADRLRALLDLVRTHAAAVLGHDGPEAVAPERALRELGFDSLTAVELRNRLNSATGLRLPATVVFDHPTATGLARRLHDDAFGTAPGADRAATVVTVADDEPIAIVAMGCRYPGGVQSPEYLWQLLAEGGDAITGFPTDRGWDLAALFDPDPDHPGTSYVREGGFLHDAAHFDPGFFGISPREALAMDPQQRLLLETSWETMERAGVAPRSLRGSRTGVFVGTNYQDYGMGVPQPEGAEGHLLTGGAASVVSGRLSYTFGLEGPAVTVDTACSSSLVALHLAIQSLRQGECDLALAGGVALMSTPASFVAFSRQRALAADGRCKAFADAADGMGMAEGVSLLLVERLSDARRNGHEVLAVIRGSAVNQDGASNGLSAPNGPSQQRVIRQALANARLEPGDIDAVEAHGTGTRLGDPIEAQALLATYGRDRDADRPLWLGSVKSNIGHTQAASGVAGVIKTVLALRHGVLPKTLHVDRPSSHVDWASGAVQLLTEARDWPETGAPRRAAVSSFGLSGTNVHTILEQAPPAEDGTAATPGTPADGTAGAVVPWVLTARTEDALRAQAQRLRAHLRGEQGVHATDVGYSLATTRSTFDRRAVVIARDRERFDGCLAALAQGSSGPGVVRGAARCHGKVAFVFPGQGSQWVGMALELLESSPAFAARMGECADALAPYTDWDLLSVLRGTEGAPSLDRVDVVQPALFAVMVSLAELWRSYGVKPDAVIGHSQGEIAAAVVAGALSLEDAARVVALRSKALLALAGEGGMVSVAAPLADVETRITAWDGRIGVAAVNGPAAVVVSGEPGALDELLAACETDGVRARRVPVDYASHHVQVERLRTELSEALAPITPRSAEVAFHSTVTGELLDTAALDAEYWYTNLRSTVRFADTTRRLAEEGFDAFIECSAHPVLAMSIQDTLEETGTEGAVVGSLRRDEGGPERFLASLAEAFVNGVDVDWSAVFADAAPRRVPLPTYPFQRQRYWLDARQAPADTAPVGGAAPGAADTAFWEAVDRNDLDALVQTLDVTGDAPLHSVLPALSSWRRQRREESTLDSWSYRIAWKPLGDQGVPVLTGRWLALLPEDPDVAETADAVLTALAERGADLVRTTVPDTAVDRAAVAGLLRTAAGDGPVDGVLSLLALTRRPHPEHPLVPLGAAATTALSLALGDADLQAPLWLLTRGAVATGPGDAPADPVQAQIWGLGRVIGLEYPDIWGGLADLPQDFDGRAADRLAAALASGDGEDQIAVRVHGTLGRRLVAADSGTGEHPRGAGRAPWKPRGTVLVTGGTGSLGAHVARWLARDGAAHLVLTSRRGPDAPGATELRAELAALGCEVTIAACDAADRTSLAGLLGKLHADGRLPHAVFHAAGLPQATPLAEATLQEYAEVAAAKVAGAAHLDELFEELRADLPGGDLDAFVLFSSNSGVWGSAGQGAYAAANAHLDALAEQRRARGRTATSVAWGLWAGGGMADGEGEEQLRRRGLRPMAPESAVAALHRALTCDEPFLAVADVDWERFAPAFTAARRRPLLEGLPQVQRVLAAAEQAGEASVVRAPAAFRDRVAALPEAERTRAVTDLVRTEAAAVLGYPDPEAVSGNRPFRDLGFDSLTAVELRNRLREATGLRLPATLVFDRPTVGALARHLVEQLVPDGAGGASVIDELDRLEAAMAAGPDDENLRMRVEMRLKSLLSTWGDDTAPAPAPVPAADSGSAVSSQLESASAEEVLSFIENELGLD
ncbi:type I polyketide synthase [Streptomyces sp. NPDC001339]